MNNTTQDKTWRPEYPEAKDVKVKLRDCEFQTFISDRRPGINVEMYSVEAPACFWVDYDHVYLRVNWSTWSTISSDRPEQVAAICNAHYCRIIYSTDNVVGECMAPVYHVDALPGNLFKEDSDDDWEDELDDPMDGKSEFQQCLERIEQIVAAFTKEVEVFPRVKIGDDYAPIVISNDEHAIIMEVLPENKDFFFVPPLGESQSRGALDDWSVNVFSLDFIKRLREMQKLLAKKEPNSIIDVGFLANATTLDSLIEDCTMISSDSASEGILNSDFKLFTYDDLGEKLASIFLVEQDMTEEDEANEADHFDREDATIADRVKEIIVEHMGLDASKVLDEASFVDDLGADELDFVELTMAFEEEFDCIFPDNSFAEFHTVKDAIDFIERLKA